MDHEAERQERLRVEGKKKKAAAIEREKAELEQKRLWAEDKKNRTYEGMFDDAAFEAQREEAGSDDDFM